MLILSVQPFKSHICVATGAPFSLNAYCRALFSLLGKQHVHLLGLFPHLSFKGWCHYLCHCSNTWWASKDEKCEIVNLWKLVSYLRDYSRTLQMNWTVCCMSWILLILVLTSTFMI